MDDHVSADIGDLHHAGHQFAQWHSATDEKFAAAHRSIEESVQSGWVGASAEAMTARLETMRTAGTAITENLNGHSTHMTSAAVRYSTTEDVSSAEIVRATDVSDSAPKLLNL